MATDPNLLVEDPQPELALEPVMDAGALPVEDVAPVPQPAPNEVEVAGLGKGIVEGGKAIVEGVKRIDQKLDDWSRGAGDEIEPVTPKPPPISEMVEGEIVLQRVPEATAQRLRDLMHLPEDFDVKLPNMTRTMPDGTVVNVMNTEDGAVDFINNMHRVFDEQIAAATRGERSLDQIALSAKSMGMHEAMLELMGRQVGDAFNSEQMYRALWVRSAMATEMDRVMREGTD